MFYVQDAILNQHHSYVVIAGAIFEVCVKYVEYFLVCGTKSEMFFIPARIFLVTY